MANMEVRGRAMMKPARTGFLPANHEAKAIKTAEMIAFVKNNIEVQPSYCQIQKSKGVALLCYGTTFCSTAPHNGRLSAEDGSATALLKRRTP